jgi:hypothetical protein
VTAASFYSGLPLKTQSSRNSEETIMPSLMQLLIAVPLLLLLLHTFGSHALLFHHFTFSKFRSESLDEMCSTHQLTS